MKKETSSEKMLEANSRGKLERYWQYRRDPAAARCNASPSRMRDYLGERNRNRGKFGGGGGSRTCDAADMSRVL